MKWFRRPAREESPAEVYSVTGASASHSDDMDQRISRYLVSMAIRTVCVILAFVVPGPMRWVFVAGAVILPYVAVIMANATQRSGGPGPTAVGVSPTRALPGARKPLAGEHGRP